MKLRQATAAIALGATAVSLSACGSKTEPTRPAAIDPATVVLAGSPSATDICLYQALAGGQFAEAGLQVSILVPTSPQAPLEMLGNGRADLVELTPAQVLKSRADGAPFVSVALLTATPILGASADPRAKPSPNRTGSRPGKRPATKSALVLAGTADELGAKGSIVRRLLQAAGRACSGGPSSLAKGTAAIAKARTVNADAQDRKPRTGAPQTVPRASRPWGWQSPDQWNALAARMRQAGDLGGNSPAATAFTNEFLAGEGA